MSIYYKGPQPSLGMGGPEGRMEQRCILSPRMRLSVKPRYGALKKLKKAAKMSK